MRDAEFAQWLQQCTELTKNPRRDAVTRCRSVERAEGSLDQHFANDGLSSLLAALAYSANDERNGAPVRHRIPIIGNVRNGSASLANAVRRYKDFSEAWPSGTQSPSFTAVVREERTVVVREPSPQAPSIPKSVSAWPEWTLPTKGDLLQLARITVPYVRFLHPDIVRAVVEDNEIHREEWATSLQRRGVDPSLYVWEKSSCAFPGVRRYAGSTEIAQYRRRLATLEGPEDALVLDDNHYPKTVWSFVLRGKRFQNQGPNGYALAHLADHKQYKNRAQEEFDVLEETTTFPALFGLYTSVTNTVYTPVGLIRPTDFALPLRNLIQRQSMHLYGSFCNLLPPHLSIRTPESGAWSLDAFDWSEPVGTMDHVPAFLDYRNQEMEKLLANHLLSE